MNLMDPLPSTPFRQKNRRGTCYLTDFQIRAPRFSTSQAELLSWLVEAHMRSGQVERSLMEALFAHYSASGEQIAKRGHELADFSHRRWDDMRLFGPAGSDLEQKTRFFDERVNEAFELFYPVETPPPGDIIHVTCTGYTAPSGA